MTRAAAQRPSVAPWRFLLLAVVASWSCWAIVMLAGPSLPHAVITVLLMAGFGAVGLVAALTVSRQRVAHEFWRAVVDVRRIGAAAWVAAVLLMPALAAIAAVLDAFATGTAIEPGALLQSASHPLALLRAFGFALLASPFLEELGWRGVALAPLERRYGALAGAALLGGVHALWHLPLFIAPEGYFHSMGLLTPAFWRFLAEIFVFDLLAAAVFNFTRGSTLAAVVFHGSFNAAAALWVLTPAAGMYRDALAALLAAALILATRTRLFFAQTPAPAAAAPAAVSSPLT
jgi:membrane protease YdiL (CAAX protease family)